MNAAAVILDRYLPIQQQQLAEILTRHAALPPPVAAKLASRATGIVWENAPPPAAQAVAAALVAAGLAARAISQDDVPAESTGRRIHMFHLDDERLGVQLKYSGPPEWVAWNDVLVISAGVFQTETKSTVVSQVALLHGGIVQDERVQVDLDRRIVAELFAIPAADRRQLLHVRLNAQEINYAQTLGATIHESWREKFALLLAKLGLRASAALISPQTEALLAAGMMPESCAIDPYFAGEPEFAAYNRWLLCRKQCGLGV